MATPRIAVTTEDDWDDETRGLLDLTGRLNVFRTLAHHPKLMKRWLVFGSHVLNKSTLPARERELAILRVGWRCDSEYEFGQHTVIGLRAGLTEDEVRRVTLPVAQGAWDDSDAALLRAVDELVDDRRIADPTWATLTERWTTQQLMDLVFAVGQYVLTCMALRTFDVPLDAGTPGFPERAGDPS
jgi:4-carboxymuconolactone decarboxylase